MTRFSDELLDAMRQVGDREVDDQVAKFFEGRDAGPASAMLLTNLHSANNPEDLVAPELLQFVGASHEAAQRLDAGDLRRGQKLFRRHGPEIFLVLACYSLPAAYAARRGVKVLCRTRRLLRNPELRLLDTAHLLVKMMSPHALDADHPGVRAALKVRLIHSVMRYRLLHDRENPWNPQEEDPPGSGIRLGLPVNQEDLAGTLLVFSWAILDGLRRLGISVDSEHEEAYMDTWQSVGGILGLEPELIPRDLGEAGLLMQRIHQRQHLPSADGAAMTAALLRLMDGFLPFFLHGLPAETMRFFLHRYPQVADDIQVPRVPRMRPVVHAGVALTRTMDRLVSRVAWGRHAYRWLGFGLIDAITRAGRKLGDEDFGVPRELMDEWLRRPARA